MNSPSDQTPTDTVFHHAERLRNSQGADADAALQALRARAAIDACDRASAWKSLGEFRRAKEALQECHAEHRGFEWRYLHASLDESHAAQAFPVAPYGQQLRAWFHEASESIVVRYPHELVVMVEGEEVEWSVDRLEIWDGALQRLKHRVEFGTAFDLLAHSRCGTRWLRIKDGRVMLGGAAVAAPIEIGRHGGWDSPNRDAAEFSPDGRQFAWRGSDGVLQMRCAETGAVLYVLEGRHACGMSVKARSLLFDRSGSYLVGLADGPRRLCAVWKLPSGKLVSGFVDPAMEERCPFDCFPTIIGMLPKFMILQLPRGEVEMRSIDGSLMRSLGRSDRFDSTGVHEDSIVVALNARAGTVITMESATGRDIDNHSVGGDGWRPLCMAAEPTHGVLAIGYENGGIRLFRVTRAGNVVPLRCFLGHTGPIVSLSWSGDGTALLSASRDTAVRIWSAWEELADLDCDLPNRSRSAWERGVSKYLDYGAGLMVVWDPRVLLCRGDLDVELEGLHEATHCMVRFAGSGRFVAVARGRGGYVEPSGGADGQVSVFDCQSGTLLESISAPAVSGSNEVFAMAFSADARRIALHSRAGVEVIDRSAGGDRRIRVAHRCGALCFDPTGARLALSDQSETDGGPGANVIVDAATGAHVVTLDATKLGHLIKEMDFSPDGAWLAAACDAFVAIWSTNTGELRWIVNSPDGVRDRRHLVWDASVGLLEQREHFEERWCRWVRFHPDGSRLSVCDSHQVRVFDAITGQLTLTERDLHHHDLSKDWLPRHGSNPADWTADSWLGLHDAPRRVREAESRHVAGSGDESPLERYRRECRGEAEATWLSDPLAPQRNESERAQEPAR
jgi:WD40 repeat protein